MSGGGGSGGGGQNTVTQTQSIPEWQKDFVIQNEQIAAGLASRPYQNYNGQLIANFTQDQQTGMGMTRQAAQEYRQPLGNAYDVAQRAPQAGAPYLAGASNAFGGVPGWAFPHLSTAGTLTTAAPGSMNPFLQAAQGYTGAGGRTWAQMAPGEQQQYMDPFVMQALQPQLAQLDIQRAQNQKGIDRGATSAGAFGDARHGVQGAMNDFYGDVTRAGVIGQGMSDAYRTGLQAFGQGQQQQLAAGQQFANMGGMQAQTLLNAGQQMANIGTAGADTWMKQGQSYADLAAQQQQQMIEQSKQLGNVAQMYQNLGLGGATAMFNAGTQQQQLNQQQLAAAYQNFMNQVNWPVEQLNMRIAAAANTPYSVMNQTTLAPGNATAMNIGAFGALAGGVGSLLNNGQSGGGIYGGT